jgi:aerobic carbon-monoxide dehydrogenase large subunit
MMVSLQEQQAEPMAQRNGNRLVGQAIRPMEDPRFISGQGEYLEDLRIPEMVDVALVRSIEPHARITSIDASAALAMPGVIAVITGDDLKDIGSVPVGGNLKIPAHPPLARDIVRFVGDPIAAVVADSRYRAQDAADAVVVTYESLPSVSEARQALAEDSPLVHEEFGSNITLEAKFEAGDVEAEFAAADHRLAVHVGHGRVAAMPMETRGGIGAYDAESDQYTLWLSTQSAWLERTDAAQALGVPEENIRVITPDVGGAFGGKMTLYRETILLLALARIVGRPVRYLATRSEDLLSSMHGREAYTDGEVAFDDDGRVRALRLRTVANFGAYLMKYSGGPPMRMLYFPTGAYDIRHVHSEAVGVFTHTGPMGPYRGAGRPEAAYFIERVMSDVAHALGMDQAEIRRRNFVPPEAFPYTNAANMTYDSGNYIGALERALELIDYENLTREIAERRQAGEVVGIGLASCVEVSGGGSESGVVTLKDDGQVHAITGTSPHGQGLATAFAQIIADELTVHLEAITVTHGDTSVGPRGIGTMGSRSLQLGGSALREAAREVRDQLLQAAAEMLEVSIDDLVLESGRIGPAGVPSRAVEIRDLVKSYVESQSQDEASSTAAVEGLEATVQFQADGESFPFGTTIAVVAIDRDTGVPSIERFVSVDDVGNVINPVLVEGQLIGGAVQGIGETLWEEVAFDGSGQPLSGTLMEYAVPRAEWLPHFELDRTVTPSPNNLLGAKGVGEAGTVHAAPTIANAVMDALRPFGVEPLDLPITPQKIWRIIHHGGAGIR